MEKIKRVIRSFSDAFEGLKFAFKNEVNIKIEVFCAAIVVILMLVLDVANQERLILIVAIIIVIYAELANTAIERIMDVVQPGQHPFVRNIKDLMAASVLSASIAALVIGLIIFIPYIMAYV
jgi:diacylglycerol kinase